MARLQAPLGSMVAPHQRFNAPALREVGLSLLLSFSTVTLGLSGLVFNTVQSQPEYLPIPLPALLSLLLFYQVLPLVIVFALDRLLAGPRLSRYTSAPYRFTLFLLVSLSFARQVQIVYLADYSELPFAMKSLWALATTSALGLLCWRGRRALTLFYLYCSPLALLLTVLFLSAALASPASTVAAAEERADQSAPGVPGPVFILLFDGLGVEMMLTSEGQIDRARFPHLAALAQDAVWFSNATSNAWYTCDSVSVLLTGRSMQPRHGRCFEGEEFQRSNVLSRLARYATVTTSSVYLSYCFDERFICLGGSSLARRYPVLYALHFASELLYHLFPESTNLPGLFSQQFYLRHRFSLRGFQELLDSINGETTADRVYFYHATLPHSPFIFDENGEAKTPVDPSDDLSLGEQFLHYRRQAQFVDLLLGRFIEQLRTQGLYDQSTIVITTDHGSRMLDIGEAAHVPLLIKSPRLQPQVSRVEYQHMDFTNTLLDVLGLPLDERAQGVSAFATQRPLRDKVFNKGPSHYVYDRDSQTWRLSPKRSGN